MPRSNDSESPRAGGLPREIADLIVTIACAALVGLLFFHIGVPAPYLLGSMLGVWAVTGLVRPLRNHMHVPRWFHKTVVLGLGVLIGAMFTPETISQSLGWLVSLSGMLLTTVFATALSFWYFRVRRGYESKLALFCSIPGGQAEVISLSRDLIDQDYVVALVHLVRVVVVFCTVPLGLALVLGESAVQNSNQNLSELPSLIDLPPLMLGQFVVTALVGYILARLLKAPVPHLMGPLFLSLALHIGGWLEIPRINEFVFLAQVTIGGAVGARLGRVQVPLLLGYLRDALVNVVLVLIVFISAAALMTQLSGFEFFNVVLSFVPGGLYEITLLSLIFGFDIAFVAVHHATRMLFILFSLPWVLRWISSREA